VLNHGLKLKVESSKLKAESSKLKAQSLKLKVKSRKLPGETPVCDREPCGLFHGAGIAQS